MENAILFFDLARLSLFEFPADMQHSFLGDVIDDTIDDTPANKIQLRDCRRKSLKLDPLRTTERIEKLFRIAIQR
jgi:hypothetical protein